MARIFQVSLFAAVLLFVTVAPNLQAEERVIVSTKVLSRYVGSSGLLAHEKPVLQTDLYLLLPKGFYADLWHSVGLDGTSMSSDFGDEIDYTFGWTGGDVKGLGVDVGVTYLDLVDLFDGRRDLLYPYLEVNRKFPLFEKSFFIPYVRVERYFPLASESFDGGTYLQAGMRHLWDPISLLTISQRVGVLYDDGAFGLGAGFVGQYNLNLGVNVAKGITLDVPTVKFTAPMSSFSDGRETQTVIGIGVTVRY